MSQPHQQPLPARIPPTLAPKLRHYPYCGGDGFGAAGVHDLNPVTWWLLKRGGIALLGPPPQEMPFVYEWATVVEYMRDNLDTYWRQFTRLSPRLSSLLAGEGVEWAVLGICRLWYALRAGDIVSKIAAGEAMLAHAQGRRRKIVAEALALRRGERSRYRLHLQRAVEAMAFVRSVIDECGPGTFGASIESAGQRQIKGR